MHHAASSSLAAPESIACGKKPSRKSAAFDAALAARTTARLLVSAGASLPLIGQMLGHTQVQTTQRYAHLFDDPMRDAAETVGRVIGNAKG